MTKRELKYSQKPGGAPDEYWLAKSLYKKFDPVLLGLPNLSTTGETFAAMTVILDLKDFTEFCDQRDPELEVPRFIKQFLNWLFKRLSEELLQRPEKGKVILSSHLPFFGKFLGDGVLFLWDVSELVGESRLNIVKAFDVICSDYENEFLKSIKNKFTKPPSKLRCGIAQGQVTSIAEGSDFVGLSINIASRLQKLGEGACSFAFTKKGLDEDPEDYWYNDFRLIRYPIRGVSKEELIYVLKKEFLTLSEKDKKRYGT